MDQKIKSRIKNHMSLVLKKPEASMNDEVILTDLVSDSFMLIEMVMELQEKFGFRINQEDLISVQTVGQLLEVLAIKFNEKTT